MDEILIILFLILLNGIFSMSEIAIISARKSCLQTKANQGNKSAKIALELSSNPDKFLSSVQIGITLIGLLTGVFSGNKIASLFSSYLYEVGISSSLAHGIAQTLIIIVVAYLTIVLGELLPKRIGMNAAEKVALLIAIPMRFVSQISAPVVWLLAKSISGLMTLFCIKNKEIKVTEEEIKSIIQEGTDGGEILPVEQDIVENVFTLGDLSINTIMTQRNDIIFLQSNTAEEEVRRIIEEHLYELYPVTDGDLDHVIGVITLKDFVKNVGKSGFSLAAMLQEPVYFHENMNVYAVLEEMKKKKISRALVCNEFGQCSGIITLKDIIEALVGEVSQEGDDKQDIVLRHGGEGYLVEGSCTIYDFLRHFGLEDIMRDFEYTTVAGLILDKSGHIPSTGEIVEWENFRFEVVDMDGPRVDKVIVKNKLSSTTSI